MYLISREYCCAGLVEKIGFTGSVGIFFFFLISREDSYNRPATKYSCTRSEEKIVELE